MTTLYFSCQVIRRQFGVNPCNLNFNMGVNLINVKCAIIWECLIVRRNGWKFGTRGPRICTCRVLLMSDSLTSVGVIWYTFIAKFPMLRFFNATALPVFVQFPTHCAESMKLSLWNCHRLLLFLTICQSLKVYGILNKRQLSYISIIHKPMLVSSGKKVKQIIKAPGPRLFSCSGQS